VFRFILSHPDMDHLDGFNKLCDEMKVYNFWDSGVRKGKPDFDESSNYEEADWDRYVGARDGTEGVKVVTPRAGSRFKYANQAEDGSGGGDGLYILSPDDKLVAQVNESGDINDGSYVILYRSMGGRIILPGDAHNCAWEAILESYSTDVADCSVLLAPHHGRDSDCDFAFLDTLRPKLTLFGCAPSEHLAYGEWSKRELEVITNNQAGNIVLEILQNQIDVYVENLRFAARIVGNTDRKNNLGYAFVGSVLATEEQK